MPNDTNRARGSSPSRSTAASLAISTAAEPSTIWDELPAVTTPSGPKRGLERGERLGRRLAARRLVDRERALRAGSGSSIGMISRSNLPPSEAASARRCDSSEYASSASRDRLHSSASSSADVPCITISYRSVTRSEIEPPFEPIGTRDIISTPAETTRSSWPAITAAAALKFVCIEEPHCRSTVVAETETGQPAASTAIRPTFQPCSPICVTQPICTSSISAGSRSCRASRPFRT